MLVFIFNKQCLSVYKIALEYCAKVVFPKTFGISVILRYKRTLNNINPPPPSFIDEAGLAQRVNRLAQVLPAVHLVEWIEESGLPILFFFSVVPESIRTSI